MHPQIGLTSEDMAQAAQELQYRRADEIETRTAMVWLARSLVAYSLYVDTRKSQWYLDAEMYANEAVEHAASGLDGTLEYVKEQLKQMRATVKTRRFAAVI